MLQLISPLKGFAIEASDGRIGVASDFLFDDTSWSMRWLVVDCGTWLTGRKVLLHPKAISRADREQHQFAVALTKAQVEGSPELRGDEPVSQSMQTRLYSYYGWDPVWSAAYLGAVPGAIASPLMAPAYLGFGETDEPARGDVRPPEADPHLRSFAEVVGYRVHAVDGAIGHIENIMVDDANWRIHYFIVDTRNWWFGKRVLISPLAVKSIDGFARHFELDVSCEQVRSSPPWDPLDAFNQDYPRQLDSHYGWPGSHA